MEALGPWPVPPAQRGQCRRRPEALRAHLLGAAHREDHLRHRVLSCGRFDSRKARTAKAVRAFCFRGPTRHRGSWLMGIPTRGDDHPAEDPRMNLRTSKAVRTGRCVAAILAAAFLGVVAGARGAESPAAPVQASAWWRDLDVRGLDGRPLDPAARWFV